MLITPTRLKQRHLLLLYLTYWFGSPIDYRLERQVIMSDDEYYEDTGDYQEEDDSGSHWSSRSRRSSRSSSNSGSGSSDDSGRPWQNLGRDPEEYNDRGYESESEGEGRGRMEETTAA
jgi:hypothetical protein